MPSPREGTQASGQPNNNTRQQPQDHQNPANLIAITKPITAPKNQYTLSQKAGKDKDENPNSGIVSVNLNRDWLDYVGLFANLLLVVVGAIYAVFMRRQWRIANIALVSQQRARIQIRSIPPTDKILQTARLACFVTIVNRGGTDARITESNCTIRLLAHPEVPIEAGVKQAEPPYSEERASFKKKILVPGETCVTSVGYHGKWDSVGLAESVQFQNDQRFFYVLGYIKYRDESGLPHETAFCRRLDRARGIFLPVKNPDYEYEE